VKKLLFVYYHNRKEYSIFYSLKEMLLSPILYLLEAISSDYPNDKRWWIKIGY